MIIDDCYCGGGGGGDDNHNDDDEDHHHNIQIADLEHGGQAAVRDAG